MIKLAHIPTVEARAASISLGVGVALMSVKFVAYFLTGSSAIFADALENIVNVAAAAFALYALYYAHLPADESHPYGHGKIEFISAGFEGGMILLAALVGTVKAVDTLARRSTVPTRHLSLALVIVTAAMVINALLGWYLVRLGKKRSSITLIADGKHLLSDAISSVAVLIGVALTRKSGLWWADPVAAVVVSAYVAWIGIRLVKHALAGLLDERDLEDEKLIQGILESHLGAQAIAPAICGYHKLRHRHSGRYHWVDFHIQVPRRWDVAEGHRVASAIEHEIQNALGEGNATAHVEPCGASECERCNKA